MADWSGQSGVRGRMRGEKGVEEFERRFELVVVGRGRG